MIHTHCCTLLHIFHLNFHPNFQLTMTPWTFLVVNLTPIDLPGLTKVAVGKQRIGCVFLVLGFG